MSNGDDSGDDGGSDTTYRVGGTEISEEDYKSADTMSDLHDARDRARGKQVDDDSGSGGSGDDSGSDTTYRVGGTEISEEEYKSADTMSDLHDARDRARRDQRERAVAYRSDDLEPEDIDIQGEGRDSDIRLSERGQERVSDQIASRIAENNDQYRSDDLNVSVDRNQYFESDDPVEVIDVGLTEEAEQRDLRQQAADQFEGYGPSDIVISEGNGESVARPSEDAVRRKIAEEEGVSPSDINLSETDDGYNIEITSDVETGEGENWLGRQRARLEDAAQTWDETASDVGETVESTFPSTPFLMSGPGGAPQEVGRTDEILGGSVEGAGQALNIPGFALAAGDLGGEVVDSQSARIDAAQDLRNMGFEEATDNPREVAGLALEASSPLPPQHTSERVSAGASAAEAAGEQLQEQYEENPQRTSAQLIGGAAAGILVPTAAARGGRALARAAPDAPRGPMGNRAQLDFTGPRSTKQRSGDPDIDIDPSRSTPDYDPRVFDDVGGRGSGQADVSEFLSGTSGRPARRGLDDRRDFAQRVRESRAETGSGGAAESAVVGGEVGRLKAAQTPFWASSGGLERSAEDNAWTGSDADEVFGSSLLEAQDSDLGLTQDTEISTGAATSRELAGETELTGVLEEEAVAQQDQTGTQAGQRGGQRARGTTRGATQLRGQTAMTSALFGQQISGPSRSPQRPIRPPRASWWPSDDIANGTDDDDSFDAFGLGFESTQETGPGWLGESITDVGVLGTEAPRSPSEDTLSDLGGFGGEVPTAQMVEGDPGVEAAVDLFSPGSGSGSDENLGFDFDFGFGEGGSDDEEGWLV